jgi:hypothetical protein
MIRSVKAIRPHQWLFLAIVVAAVGYAGFEITAQLGGGNGGMKQPDRQAAPDDAEAALRIGWHRAVDGHSVICHPEDHHAGYTYTRHRYPRTVGGEVTNTIHRGFSSMRVPNSDSVQWLISPPSEAAW